MSQTFRKLVKEEGKKETCHCGTEIVCVKKVFQDKESLQWQNSDGKAHFNYDYKTGSVTCNAVTKTEASQSVVSPQKDEVNDSIPHIQPNDFMVIANDDAKNSVKDFIELIENEDDITLNCGIGNAKTGREAVKLATKSLDTIREIRDSGKEKPDVYELSC